LRRYLENYMLTDQKRIWEQYCSDELSVLSILLQRKGYILSEVQPHLGGERYLMQAVSTTSGRKLILYGTHKNGTQVVIKASRDQAGQNEISHERQCREFLTSIDFASTIFHTPEELDYFRESGFLISVQKFIDQKLTFLERPLRDQFDYALEAFKGQEGTHATTYKHLSRIKKVYGIRTGDDYVENFAKFHSTVSYLLPEEKPLHRLLSETYGVLSEEINTIDQYSNFLTHTDFVPHNFRIDTNGIMYLLDYSSLIFGNKYESWARFLNFMTLYNTKLESALVKYVTLNRSTEEQRSLTLMRLYRLGEIIRYYTGTLEKSEGNLKQLNEARINFWSEVLKATLDGRSVLEKIRVDYQITRDSLRSDDERKRQVGLH